MKAGPCFFSLNRKIGILSSIRISDRLHHAGVCWEMSMDVPDMPLSKSFTGARNMTTPKALMMPAAVRNRKCRTSKECRTLKNCSLILCSMDFIEVCVIKWSSFVSVGFFLHLKEYYIIYPDRKIPLCIFIHTIFMRCFNTGLTDMSGTTSA